MCSGVGYAHLELAQCYIIGSVLGDYSTVTGLDIESMGKLIGFS